MKLDNIAHAGEQLKNEVTEFAEKARDFSGNIKERMDAAGRDIQRGVRRTKEAANDAVEHTRHNIKANPLAAVALTAAGAFAAGMLMGWLLKSRRD